MCVCVCVCVCVCACGTKNPCICGDLFFLSHQEFFSFFFYNIWCDVSGCDIALLLGLYYIYLCIDTFFFPYLRMFECNGGGGISNLVISTDINHLLGCGV